MINNTTNVILKKSLGGLSLRQKAISNNIANAETPGYNRQVVAFEKELRSALEEGNPTRVSPKITRVRVGDTRNDKSNVDVEAELVALTDTNLRFNAGIDLLRKQHSLLKFVINEGRG